MGSYDTLAPSQLACKSCPLYINGTAPIYVPLHVKGGFPLIVMDRPFSDVKSPIEDPRARFMLSLDARLACSAITYLTSCWSDRSQDIPNSSIRSCARHRRSELEMLKPSIIYLIGRNAARLFNDYQYQPNTETMHSSGFTLVFLPASPDKIDRSLVAKSLSELLISYDLC